MSLVAQEASLREELGKITREREEIELDVEAASSRLRAAGVGMDEALVDPEGFPLPNLDLASIRADRHLVVTRMNDHKALTNRAEAIVKELLEERAKASGGGGGGAAAATAAAAPVSRPPPPPPHQPRPPTEAPLVPFAVVDDVSPASPAEVAGVRRGDRVVRFGSVSCSTPSSPLSRLPAEVSSALSARGSISVVVLRAGGGGSEGEGGANDAAVREICLRLTPREGWGGRGALGCHLRPL